MISTKTFFPPPLCLIAQVYIRHTRMQRSSLKFYPWFKYKTEKRDSAGEEDVTRAKQCSRGRKHIKTGVQLHIVPKRGTGKKESEVPVSWVTLGEGDCKGTKTDMQIKIPWIAKPVKTNFGNVTPSYKYRKGNPPPAYHCLARK